MSYSTSIVREVYPQIWIASGATQLVPEKHLVSGAERIGSTSDLTGHRRFDQ